MQPNQTTTYPKQIGDVTIQDPIEELMYKYYISDEGDVNLDALMTGRILKSYYECVMAAAYNSRHPDSKPMPIDSLTVDLGMHKRVTDLPRNPFYQANYVVISTLEMQEMSNFMSTQTENESFVLQFGAHMSKWGVLAGIAGLCAGGQDAQHAMMNELRLITAQEFGTAVSGLDGAIKEMLEKVNGGK